ncbi:MAG: hypothetical protein HN348_24615, partial [Proteobacteria bacterium]|nr:hypothetical protein [Pseudomonadota bacterium]
MANNELERLLIRVRDGLATPEEYNRARVLAQADPRLPEVLRQGVLDEEAQAEAAGLLALLGVEDGLGPLLRDAVLDEAGIFAEARMDDAWQQISDTLREGLEDEAFGVEVVDDVFARLEIESLPPIAESVRFEAGVADLSASISEQVDATAPLEFAEALFAEAGQIDIAHAVMAEIGAEQDLGLSEAVAEEAGAIDLSASIMAELGVEAMPLAEAANAEAGTIDIANAIMACLGEEALPLADAVLDEAGTIDIADAIMLRIQRDVRAPIETLPQPANSRRWAWATVATFV